MTGAILQCEPDWLALKCMPDEPCATAVKAILCGLESTERRIYAIRGEALRLFDDRKLYTLFDDPAHGGACAGTWRWLEIYMPDTARYCQEALKSRQALAPFIPLEEAAKIPRCNLRLLETASDNVKSSPEVHVAAETQSQTQFAATLSRDYHQHIEASVTLKFKLPAGDAAIVEQALDIVGEKCGIDDRAGELLAWAIDYVAENMVTA